MMALAFITAYFVLGREIRLRHLKIDPYSVVAYVALAGIVGAKIWHVIDTPDDRLDWATLHSLPRLVSWLRGGVAWFGGFVAGIATLLLLARHYRVKLLTMLDLSSPAAAIGYAIGRIGCLLSGDGDYGRPTSWSWPWGMSFPNGTLPSTKVCVATIDAAHPQGWPADCNVYPTPIYEFLVCMLIFWYISRRSAKAVREGTPPGLITGEFLMLFGAERFLVEFIRINPRVIFGMSNAQFAALLTMIAGAILMLVVTASRTVKASQSA